MFSGKINTPNSRRSQSFIAQFSSLDDVREFVGQVAEDFGMSPDVVYKVQMATDEAFSNIVEHGYEGGANVPVECICYTSGNALVIELRDQGKPFNPSSVPEPNLKALLDEREEGGLGLFFMRKLMDEVRFELLPAKGEAAAMNQVTMVKYKEL